MLLSASLQPLRAFLQQRNARPFIQAPIAGRFDRRKMNEDVFAILTRDKSKPLRSIEPLYCSSFFHIFSLFFSLSIYSAILSDIARFRAIRAAVYSAKVTRFAFPF